MMGRQARLAASLAVACCFLVVDTRGLAAGQAAEQPAAQPEPPVADSPDVPAPPPAPGEAYNYDPAGRRDPFVSLLSRGTESAGPAARPSGLQGLLINDVALRGILQSEGAFVAILQAPDNKTYIVHPGDRLFDGGVKSIGANAVVFVQQVNDPLSLVKQREVRKPLRVAQEGR